jgi:hypothetical protein
MFAVVLLTFVVGLLNFRARVGAVRNEGLDPKYFKTFTAGQPSHRLLQVGRHFNNLFEVPTLFYAGCLAAMMVGLNSQLSLFFAWLFVAARIVHAYIHLGSNKVAPRAGSFFVGFTAVLALWVCIVIHVAALR